MVTYKCFKCKNKLKDEDLKKDLFVLLCGEVKFFISQEQK